MIKSEVSIKTIVFRESASHQPLLDLMSTNGRPKSGFHQMRLAVAHKCNF